MFESKRDVVTVVLESHVGVGGWWGRGEQVTDGLEKAEMRISQGTIAITMVRTGTVTDMEGKGLPFTQLSILQMFTGREMH